MIEACPQCDSSQIQNVVGHYEGPNDIESCYRCASCQAHFEQPTERESKTDSTVRSGFARKLEKADPDAIGGGK